MHINTCSNPAEKAAETLAKLLMPKTLLLLAGGSAKDVYMELPKYLIDHKYEEVVVCMEDERWNINPHHVHSNFESLKSMDFLKKLKTKGALVTTILNGLHIDQDTSEFNQLIDSYIKKDYKIVLFMGIGKDGHTAGIIPTDEETFNKTYNTGAWAVYHTNIDPIFPKRITITPKTIHQADNVVVYAIGAEKANILRKLASQVNISKMPAKLFSEIDATIFTDSNI